MYLKWVIGVFFLVMLGGCKDLLNQPLKGEPADNSRYKLEGKWIAEDKEKTHLELKKTDKDDWYQFSVMEADRLIEGKLMVAYFKRRMALSVDITSVKINGESLVREDRQGYFLIGAYYDDDELYIAPAKMEKFERNFADYFFASPIDTASFCAKTNETCKETFASGNLLFSKNRRKFNDDFVKYFRTVFPRRDSITFVPSAN